MSVTDDIINEIISRGQPTLFSGGSRSRRSRRSSGRGGGAFLGQQQEDLNVPDLGAREQYRYRLAQTAAQLGAGEDVIDSILEASGQRLQAFEQALTSDDPQRGVQQVAATPDNFFDDTWVERNVGAPVGSTLGFTFRQLARPLNAFTGGLTEILRDDPGLNPLGLGQAFGRGVGRGFMLDEQYGTRSILNELENYEVGGRELPVPEGGPLRVGAEFAGDVALDPLTYLTAGTSRAGGTFSRVDDAVTQARDFASQAVGESQLQRFRQLPVNTRGPIVEQIIKDAYRRPRNAAGRFRPRSVLERTQREAMDVYDPVLNRGVPRPDYLPAKAPSTYKARENLVEMLLEKDDLHRLRTGHQQVRLEDFLQNHSRLAANGYLDIRFAGRQILGDETLPGVSRTLYSAGARARHKIGYKASGDARLGNRLFNFNRRDIGELPSHIRRAQGNYAGWGEAALHDLGNARRLVDDDQMDEIVDALDALKDPKIDPETVWEQLDQIPLNSTVVGDPVYGVQPHNLQTAGDVGRFFQKVMDSLTDLEKSYGLRATDEAVPVFPVRPKDGRTLSNAELKLPYRELKRRGVNFHDPLSALADNVSYRLANLASAEATVTSLEQYIITIPDLRAGARKITRRDEAKLTKRTSKAGSQLQEAQLGDLQPTTQELLRGNAPIVEPGATPFLNTPDGAKFAQEVAEEAARRGVARVGLMEFVPVTKINSPVARNWLAASDLAKNDLLIPRPIAEALDEMHKFATRSSEAGNLLRTYDRIMSGWKKAVTVYNPGYHIRNSFSDYFMNVAAGVRGPIPYEKATRVITNRFRHAETNAGQVLRPLQAIGEQGRSFIRGERIKFAGQTVKADEIWHLYSRYSGAKSGQIRAELTNIIDRAATKRGKPGAALTRFSEGREDFMRLAHFIDRFEKVAKKRGIKVTDNGVITAEAQQLAREVGDKVRMYNLDYGARTPFERDVLSRAIPFYTYIRRNLPLQVQLLLTQPGMIARYPKYKNLFEGLMGNPEEDDSMTLVPQWVQRAFPWVIETESRRNSGPLGQLLDLFGAGGESGAVVMPMESMLPVGTLNEFNEITGPLLEGRLPSTEEAQRGLANTLSSVAPSIRAPFEFATGEQLFTGSEIGSPLEYLLGQVPVGRIGGRALGVGNDPNGPADDFMRWLTGLPVRQITPAAEQSEFRRREDTLEAVRGQVLDQVNQELTEMGLEEVTSLPALDSDELIQAILAAATRQRRQVQYSPEYLANG